MINGEFEAKIIINGVPYCPKCKEAMEYRKIFNDRLYIFPVRCKCQEEEYQKQKTQEQKAKQEFERQMQIHKLRANGIAVKSYHNWTFESDDMRTPKLTMTIREYVDKFEDLKEKGQGLILWGDLGTGKTYYAMCIANALIDNGYKVYATSPSQIVMQMSDISKAEERFKRLMSYDLIVLDDLGTERSTNFATEQIYEFINGCNVRSIPLVITTNYTPAMLKEASQNTEYLSYARIYSRILEKCCPIKINVIKRRDNKAIENRADISKRLGL